MKKLTHTDEHGAARMVDVSGKPITLREAVAEGAVVMQARTVRLIRKNELAKGDVLAAARIAAIMAAKRTPEIIPLCHTLSLSSVAVDFRFEKDRVVILSKVKTGGQTGVEMEALVAVSVAALTIYDMCKAVDKRMTISDIVLLEKSGGRSGHFRR